MPSFYEFKSIPIKDISVTDEWNLTPFLDLNSGSNYDTFPIPIGNIQPPIVKDCGHPPGNYTLISGESRLRSVQVKFPEQSHITVLILPADISDDDILLYLLGDKNIHYNFSDMEKSFFIRLCNKKKSLEEVSKTYLPLLGEKPQTHIAKKLLSLTTLEPNLQKSIHANQLASKLAFDLLTLPAIDRMTLHSIFRQLELGGGKQRRLYALCKDLSRRNNTDITTLLADNDYLTILNHTEMNIPQKGTLLLSLLQKHLFPQSTEAENSFTKRVRNMNFPENCAVEHSQAFEEEEISIIIKFKNIEQLEEQAFRIKEILD